MVQFKDSIIILDNGISVLPQIHQFCYKCKKSLVDGIVCNECKHHSYQMLFNLGYYISRWYRRIDKYISSNIRDPYDIKNIKPEYQFSKMINDAKQRWEYNTINQKKEIIKILSNGFAWMIKNEYSDILDEIDLIVHVPKKNEDPINDESDVTLFNHGYYYARYIADNLEIDFEPNNIYEESTSTKNDRKFKISNSSAVSNKTIMIIDDAYTNADTKGPISDGLLLKGAFRIYIGVIARSISNY
ncbi:MAG: hypothetical protein V3V33_10130 [Candidatus Lokiarchaeia archaeon]